jgi:hypothetical protein
MSGHGDRKRSDAGSLADLRPLTGKRYAVWPMFYGRSHRIVKTSLIALRAPKGQPMFTKIPRIQVINPGRKIAELPSHVDVDSTADGFHESVAFDSAGAARETCPFPISGPVCW